MLKRVSLWAVEANHMELIVGATYGVLPTLQSGWVKTEAASCELGVGSLKHFLSSFKASLLPGSLHVET